MKGSGGRSALLVSVAVTCLCLALMACSSPPKQTDAPAPAAAPAAQTQAQRFDLKGKVMVVDKSGKRLTVDHEDIPGLMGAMIMGYAVKDDRLLDGLKAGDQVTAKVVSSGGEYWLEDIVVANAGPPAK